MKSLPQQFYRAPPSKPVSLQYLPQIPQYLVLYSTIFTSGKVNLFVRRLKIFGWYNSNRQHGVCYFIRLHCASSCVFLNYWTVWRSSCTALWRYPHVKWEIENLSQITTTAPIFLQFNYFRQKYLEIASCAVSLLNNIWVRVEHSLLQQLNLQKVNCSSSSLQAGCE